MINKYLAKFANVFQEITDHPEHVKNFRPKILVSQFFFKALNGDDDDDDDDDGDDTCDVELGPSLWLNFISTHSSINPLSRSN